MNATRKLRNFSFLCSMKKSTPLLTFRLVFCYSIVQGSADDENCECNQNKAERKANLNVMQKCACVIAYLAATAAKSDLKTPTLSRAWHWLRLASTSKSMLLPLKMPLARSLKAISTSPGEQRDGTQTPQRISDVLGTSHGT